MPAEYSACLSCTWPTVREPTHTCAPHALSPQCSVPEECPAEVRDLILECLETRPSRRPAARDIVQRLDALRDAPAPLGALAGTPPAPGASPTASMPRRYSHDGAVAFKSARQAAFPGTAAGGSSGGGGSSRGGGTTPRARATPPAQAGSTEAGGSSAAGSSASQPTDRMPLGPRSCSLPVVPPSVASQVHLQLFELLRQPGASAAGSLGGEANTAGVVRAAPAPEQLPPQPGEHAQQAQRRQEPQGYQISAVRHSA